MARMSQSLTPAAKAAQKTVDEGEAAAPAQPDVPIDDHDLNLDIHGRAEEISAEDLERLAEHRGRVHEAAGEIVAGEPGRVVIDRPGAEPLEFEHREPMAFGRPLPKLPEGFLDLGGLPAVFPEEENAIPVLPGIDIIRRFPFAPWGQRVWTGWDRLPPFVRCFAVPPKPTRVEIAVGGSPAMVKVAADCARAYVVNNQGTGSVVNVVTENVDATFQVDPHPAPTQPYPPPLDASTAVVSPFIKGGLNQKYRRLYVPASFYGPGSNGGFFVAVVDVNPASGDYLNTIGWVDCGWLPEQVSFTQDGETGVVANYMEGTLTIFRVSDHATLDEVALFPGAGVDENLAGNAGTFARSVVTTTVPGKGNVALASLTDVTGFGGVAVVELDDPSHPVTNLTRPEFGFIDGVAVTPQKDRVLLVDATSAAPRLHVYRIQGAAFVFEKSIALPTGGSGRVYMGGIAVRPSGNLAFLGTGRSPTQGIGALTCVNYDTDTVLDLPDSIADGTWDLVIRSFGLPLKPYIFVASTSGKLTIIPC